MYKSEKNIMSKILVVLLALAMLLGSINITVFADNDAYTMELPKIVEVEEGEIALVEVALSSSSFDSYSNYTLKFSYDSDALTFEKDASLGIDGATCVVDSEKGTIDIYCFGEEKALGTIAALAFSPAEEGNVTLLTESGVGNYESANESDEYHAAITNATTTIVIKEAGPSAAQLVEEMIAAIGTVTDESEPAIREARDAYEALTDEEKAEVSPGAVQTLENDELKLENIKQKAAIDNLQQQIEDLEKQNEEIANTIDMLVKLLATPAEPAIKVNKTLDTSVGAVIKWGAADKADSYEIYRRVDMEAEFELIGTTTELSYTDTDAAEKNIFYEYEVVSVHNVGDKVYKSEASNIKFTIFIEAPKLISVKNAEDGVMLTWDTVDNADGYLVYRKDEGDEKYGKPKANAKSGDRTTLTNKNAREHVGEKVRYRICAYRYYGDERVLSAKSNYKDIRVE